MIIDYFYIKYYSMSDHIISLINMYAEYYTRKANLREGKKLVIQLCSACNTSAADMPRYNNNIVEWYENVTAWLIRKQIISS